MASEQLARPLAEPPYPEKEKENQVTQSLFNLQGTQPRFNFPFISSTQTKKLLQNLRKFLRFIRLFATALQRQRRHPGHLAKVLDLLPVKLPIHPGIRQADDASDRARGIQQRETDHRKQEL